MKLLKALCIIFAVLLFLGQIVSWSETEVSEQSGTSQEPEEPTVVLITFTVGKTQHQVEAGMTWREFVNSTYNSDGKFEAVGEYVMYDGQGYVLNVDGEKVLSSATIVSGSVYTLKEVAAPWIPIPIMFTVGETQYQAEAGMTWREFVNSTYNSDGKFEAVGEYVMYDGQGYVLNVDGEKVTLDMTITSGSVYTVELIMFILSDGSSYQAEAGMTWENFIGDTTYNLNRRFVFVDGYVKVDMTFVHLNGIDSGYYVLNANGERLTSDMMIMDGAVYTLRAVFVEPEEPTIELITFTLEGVDYQVEAGTTWEEFAQQQEMIDGPVWLLDGFVMFSIDDAYYYVVDVYDAKVKAAMLIIDGWPYYCLV